MTESADLSAIHERLDEIANTFQEQLTYAKLESNRKQVVIADQMRRLEQAEPKFSHRVQSPFIFGLASLIDRLDGYGGHDTELATTIRDELLDILAAQGIEPVDTNGEFDPTKHQAVARINDPDRPARAVVDVWNRGYARDNEVFKHAKVVVNQPTPQADPPDSGRT